MDRIPYRLVWFQHFHKAGGTSVVELARWNGETFYPRHNNANPLTPRGERIPLWEYDARALERFVDDCEHRGVTFVATEWGLPLVDRLALDARVATVTCLREPLQRFLSNYRYALLHGTTSARSAEAFAHTRSGHDRVLTMYNYYCRILGRHFDRPDPVDERIFRTAERNLAAFDHAVTLEQGLAALSHALGWRHREICARRTDYGLGKGLRFLARGRIDLLLRRIRRGRWVLPPGFVERFEQANAWDIRLYRQVAGIAAPDP